MTMKQPKLNIDVIDLHDHVDISTRVVGPEKVTNKSIGFFSF